MLSPRSPSRQSVSPARRLRSRHADSSCDELLGRERRRAAPSSAAGRASPRGPRDASGLREPREPRLVAHDEAVALGRDDALLAPAAHDADAGLGGGARQVGELLAGEGHRHETPVRARLAEALGQLQEQVRDARLDVRGYAEHGLKTRYR